MRFPGKGGRFIAGVAGALIICAGATPSRAQAPVTTDKLIERLSGQETAVDLDVAALKQQAAERVRSKADPQPVKRPPIAPQLLKLPQLLLDIKFDTDSPIIRPESYQLVGQLADALTNPSLQTSRFLIVGHVDATGRRDHNLILSQRRADAIRDALINTFKVSPKRLQAIGLGEEQLRDAVRPAAPINQQLDVMTVGKMP
jgi:outer membrane protein OmpA-like peptidoglycan-associated protein